MIKHFLQVWIQYAKMWCMQMQKQEQRHAWIWGTERIWQTSEKLWRTARRHHKLALSASTTAWSLYPRLFRKVNLKLMTRDTHETECWCTNLTNCRKSQTPWQGRFRTKPGLRQCKSRPSYLEDDQAANGPWRSPHHIEGPYFTLILLQTHKILTGLLWS